MSTTLNNHNYSFICIYIFVNDYFFYKRFLIYRENLFKNPLIINKDVQDTLLEINYGKIKGNFLSKGF